MARMMRMLFLAALLALPVPMALAGHKASHAGGNQSAVTEDNDSDGVPNNIPDPRNDHPSGNDKSVEKGGSGNQGNSQSDPDGLENGGADKPGGTGGEDPLDQDGNNGCGNDDDFEDDNNGWCGKPVENQNVPQGNSGQVGGGSVGGGSVGGGSVGGAGLVRGGRGGVLGELVGRGGGDVAEVLGVVFGRGAGAAAAQGAQAGALAFTGGPIAGLALLALTLLAGGLGLRTAARPRGRHRAA